MITRRGLAIAISASLIVGCAIGLIAGVLFARSLLAPRLPMGPPRHGPGGPRPGLEFVERRLGLTPDQARRFDAIIESARAQSDSMHDLTRQRILEVLTPEQRERWQRMNERMFGRRGAGREPMRPRGEFAPPDSR